MKPLITSIKGVKVLIHSQVQQQKALRATSSSINLMQNSNSFPLLLEALDGTHQCQIQKLWLRNPPAVGMRVGASPLVLGTRLYPKQIITASPVQTHRKKEDSVCYHHHKCRNWQGTLQKRKITKSYSGNLHKTWFDQFRESSWFRSASFHQRQSSQKIVFNISMNLVLQTAEQESAFGKMEVLQIM